MAGFLGTPKVQYFKSDGSFAASYYLYTYEPGTTTNKATYPTIADALAGTNANANPITLDSRGQADVVLTGNTKLVLYDDLIASGGSVIESTDNVNYDEDTLDANGNRIVEYNAVSSAVNWLKLSNAATGNDVIIEPAGTDDNIGVTIQGKGSGSITIPGLSATSMVDSNDVDVILTSATASAVNEFTAANAATGNSPTFSATGDDTNIGENFQIKGNEAYHFLGTADTAAEIKLYEDTDNGTNYFGLKAPAALTASTTFTLPDGDGTNGQVLGTNGSGTLDWITGTATTILLQSETPTSGTEVDLTTLSSTYFCHIIDIADLTPATDDVYLYLRLSTDSGSTFISTAGAYRSAGVAGLTSGAVTSVSSATDNVLFLTATSAGNAVGSGTNESLSGRIIIYNPLSSSDLTKITANLTYATAGGGLASVTLGGELTSTTLAVNAVRLAWEGGATFESGEIRLYGVKAA